MWRDCNSTSRGVKIIIWSWINCRWLKVKDEWLDSPGLMQSDYFLQMYFDRHTLWQDFNTFVFTTVRKRLTFAYYYIWYSPLISQIPEFAKWVQMQKRWEQTNTIKRQNDIKKAPSDFKQMFSNLKMSVLLFNMTYCSDIGFSEALTSKSC